MKQFKTAWGDWEPGANSYQPKESTENQDFFCTDNGYDTEEIQEINQLPVGGVWNSPLGNHRVTRIK